MNYERILHKYGKEGVERLAAATPVRTGKTAASWDYEIEINKNSLKVRWINTNVVNGISIIILLRYGHATKSGYFVEGHDFIEPTLKPILKALEEEIWEEVVNA